MTGKEHFIYAEQSLKNMDGITLSAAEAIAFAQVHATLALVWVANRAQTEVHGLLMAMLDREAERADAAGAL